MTCRCHGCLGEQGRLAARNSVALPKPVRPVPPKTPPKKPYTGRQLASLAFFAVTVLAYVVAGINLHLEENDAQEQHDIWAVQEAERERQEATDEAMQRIAQIAEDD